MTEGALSSTFDLSGISSAIRGDRARRALVATPVPTDETPITTDKTIPIAIEPFECPITVDNETDVVLLIKAGNPILSGVDKNIANDIYDCPLNLLNYPELVTLLKERIDHAISLRALKDSYDSGNPIISSPMTRFPISEGAICLGANELHCKATTWTLANLLTGGKLVGNQDLWFACIWLLVDSDEGIPYLQPIISQVREHMKWRMLNHKTSVSLTGRPEFPITMVSLRTAIWYIFASAEISMPPRRDVLRTHLLHVQPLKKLLSLCKLEINDRANRHIVRLRVMLSMLSEVKKNQHLFRCLIQTLTQNCLEVDIGALRVSFERKVRFVPLDGDASEAQVQKVLLLLPPHYKNLSVAELVSIAKLVDPSKSAGDIEFPIEWDPVLPESSTIYWGNYGLRDIKPSLVRICYETCRSYYQVGDETWKIAAQRFYGCEPSMLLSVDEHFIKFVQRYHMYPNFDELITYLYHKRVVRGYWYKTLPFQTAQFALSTIKRFSEVSSTLSVDEFIRRTKASQAIETRCAIEIGTK
jgi:hypothetical protein